MLHSGGVQPWQDSGSRIACRLPELSQPWQSPSARTGYRVLGSRRYPEVNAMNTLPDSPLPPEPLAVSISAGDFCGKSDPDNLRALCFTCNAGKGVR